MNGRADRIAATEKVVRLSLEVAAIERRLHEDDKAAAALIAKVRELELAMRDAVVVIDDLRPGEQPRGWQITPDEKP